MTITTPVTALADEWELRLPFDFAFALVLGGVCPACLEWLRSAECPNCKLDVTPIWSAAEVREESSVR